MFYCAVFTKPECFEHCCFLCPELKTCPYECKLAGIDDKCLYTKDEPEEK